MKIENTERNKIYCEMDNQQASLVAINSLALSTLSCAYKISKLPFDDSVMTYNGILGYRNIVKNLSRIISEVHAVKVNS